MKKVVDTKKITDSSKAGLKMIKTKTGSIYSKSPKILIGILILLLLGGGYAYFKKNESKKESLIVSRGALEEAVSVTGKIKASTDADLSFEKGGTVAAVYVKEGQKVYAGQTLMVLSGGTDYGQVLEARAGVQSAQAQLDQISTGSKQEEVTIRKTSIEDTKQTLSNTLLTVPDNTRVLYNTINDALRVKTQGFFYTRSKNEFVVGLNTCDTSLENIVEPQRTQMEIILTSWDKTFASFSSNEERLDRSLFYAEKTAKLLDAMNDVVTSNCTISEPRFDSYRSSISASKIALSNVTAELTNKKNQIASNRVSILQAENQLSLTESKVERPKIAGAEAALRQAFAKLYQAQAASSKNIITAPGAGLVTKIDISAGEYASPGKSVARVVGTGEYTVEANVTESDIARIILENNAKVIIPAIDAKEVFVGKVVSIDPAEQSQEGNPLYRIIIALDGTDARIKSGMTAETTIVTSVVENILRIPTRFVTKIKGVSKVQVVIDSKSLETEERDIKIGRKSTDGNVEIVSGLEEGEIIILPTAPKK